MTINYDGTDPGLTLASATFSLGTNAITVNASSPLAVGQYNIIQSGVPITDGGSYPPATGTAISFGRAGAITVSGTNVILTITQLPPLTSLRFTAAPKISGKNLTISGANVGTGFAYLLSTTNLTPPVIWTPVWTNPLNASGSFTNIVTNGVNTNDSRQFYILSNTNN
jgi:hypothetical protein